VWNVWIGASEPKNAAHSDFRATRPHPAQSATTRISTFD
jgi:hypothetical protein